VSTGDAHSPLVQRIVNRNKVALAVLIPERSAIQYPAIDLPRGALYPGAQLSSTIHKQLVLSTGCTQRRNDFELPPGLFRVHSLDR